MFTFQGFQGCLVQCHGSQDFQGPVDTLINPMTLKVETNDSKLLFAYSIQYIFWLPRHYQLNGWYGGYNQENDFKNE